jgi:hypothetical protein
MVNGGRPSRAVILRFAIILISLVTVSGALPGWLPDERRPVRLMLAVDRSGSVQRAGTGRIIKDALSHFVTGVWPDGSNEKPAFVEGHDFIGMGTFGGSWKLDFAPSTSFRSGNPDILSAIREINFYNGVTNTSEGLYRAYEQLQRLGDSAALNVIVLLTDGRPNAFTANFDVTRACDPSGKKLGYITAMIGTKWPPLPPMLQGEDGIYTLGLFKSDWSLSGDMTLADGGIGCEFTRSGRLFHRDAPSFPEIDAYGNGTTGPAYPIAERANSSPRAVRYASINAADNMAARIRTDSTLRPLLIAIGLHQPAVAGEPLDADWLRRIANDPSYREAKDKANPAGKQTSGRYFDVTPATLDVALREIASLIWGATTATPPNSVR